MKSFIILLVSFLFNYLEAKDAFMKHSFGEKMHAEKQKILVQDAGKVKKDFSRSLSGEKAEKEIDFVDQDDRVEHWKVQKPTFQKLD